MRRRKSGRKSEVAVSCKNCAWYARAHYKGTGKEYDECECHWEVLHDMHPCKDFTTKRGE